MKKLYGVGTGPGDKEYLTLKAVKVIQQSEVIFAPNNKGKNMALDTVKDFIKGKKVIFVDFPMKGVDKTHYENAAIIIEKEMQGNRTGVFLTIGDPLVYSTFSYLIENIEKRNIEVEIVSGIPSFLASAALVKKPITIRGDRFILCDKTFDEDILKKCDSIAILKATSNKEELLNKLEKNGFDYTYVKRVTLEGEESIIDKNKILENKDYISLILGRRGKHD